MKMDENGWRSLADIIFGGKLIQYKIYGNNLVTSKS